MMSAALYQDVRWAASRAARYLAYASVPLHAHFELARARGRRHARRGAPEHVIRNLETALGGARHPEEIEAVARDFVRFRQQVQVWKFLPQLPGFRRRRWPISGVEHLDRALDEARGVILVGAHLGYSRLIPPILRVHGYDVLGVTAPLKGRLRAEERRREFLARSGRLIRKLYERTEVSTRPMNEETIAAALDVRLIHEALAKGRIVFIAGDGLRASAFCNLSLFGHPFPFATGFVRLAMFTGSPVVPVFALEGTRRQPIRVVIHPAMRMDPVAKAEENLMGYVRILERQIQETPHLWRRWGVADLFAKVQRWSMTDPTVRYQGRWRR